MTRQDDAAFDPSYDGDSSGEPRLLDLHDRTYLIPVETLETFFVEQLDDTKEA